MAENADITSEFYTGLDSLFDQLLDTLNKFEKSEIFQEYFFSILESAAYATVIDNFFSNLTEKNISEPNLSRDEIDAFKRAYKSLQTDVKSTLLGMKSSCKVNQKRFWET